MRYHRAQGIKSAFIIGLLSSAAALTLPGAAQAQAPGTAPTFADAEAESGVSSIVVTPATARRMRKRCRSRSARSAATPTTGCRPLCRRRLPAARRAGHHRPDRRRKHPVVARAAGHAVRQEHGRGRHRHQNPRAPSFTNSAPAEATYGNHDYSAAM